MSNFEEIIGALGQEIKNYAQDSWFSYKEAAIKDGMDFVDKLKNDLERWTIQLANQQISKDEFTFLVKAKADLVTLNALKQEGLAKTQYDKFINGLISAVISSVFKII
ncbi:hypothetical protein [Pectobacterium brasiliense]|uniref:hypothetical protein n=1 Tax=Pectobacterium brasiliense TaxID=180957 RepID=UPI00196990D4|nr:hypothetical protein [Pectobacterium brasiliense]MBN3264327.1 hypothetical protein [Pectobacterium brasiliense]